MSVLILYFLVNGIYGADIGVSKHNKGTAVDITLIDENNNELEMPSIFDDFTDKASRLNDNMSDVARRNLNMLTNIMVENGFTPIDSEWWHFNDSDSDKYQIVNVNPEDFYKSSDKNSVTQEDKIFTYNGDQYVNLLDQIKSDGEYEQVVLITSKQFDTVMAKAYTFEKENGKWHKVFEPFDVVIGGNGFTYDKVEGDKKSPIGIFSIERCFSRMDNPGTKLSFTKFNENDFWVDDPDSIYYNTYQKGLPNGRWSSAEDLYAIGMVYNYFLVIEYNTVDSIPGKGSAIFFHIWSGKDSSTMGCTAMDEDNLLKIIRWVDPSKKPVLIQCPESEVYNLLKYN